MTSSSATGPQETYLTSSDSRGQSPSQGIYPVLYKCQNGYIQPTVPSQDKVLTAEIIECIRQNGFTLKNLWTAAFIRLTEQNMCGFAEDAWGLDITTADRVDKLADYLEEGMFMDDETLREYTRRGISTKVKRLRSSSIDGIDSLKWEDIETLLKGESFTLVRRIGLPKVRVGHAPSRQKLLKDEVGASDIERNSLHDSLDLLNVHSGNETSDSLPIYRIIKDPLVLTNVICIYRGSNKF